MIKEEKGVTLIALVITIIILLIIAGISINGAVKVNKETKESALVSELRMVQNSVLQRKTKVDITNIEKDLPGVNINKVEVQKIVSEINKNIILKGETYKKLSIEDLKKLGISNTKDSYIVNYDTGEVINETVRKTETGKPLYLYAIDKKNI